MSVFRRLAAEIDVSFSTSVGHFGRSLRTDSRAVSQFDATGRKPAGR
jgi:hypothetical protein